MASIFVSYSSRDSEFANELANRLGAKGHDVWRYQGKIFGGANYFKEIADAIKRSDIIMPVLTPNSVSSEWVEREIYHSVEDRKSIIPVLAEFTSIPDKLRLALAGINNVDFTSNTRDNEQWDELEHAIAEVRSNQSAGINREDTSTSSYQNLYNYFSESLKRKKSLRRISVTSIISILLTVGILIGRYILPPDLPAPDTIQVKAVTADIQDVIRLVYTTPLKQDTPSASVAVMTNKAGSGLNVLQDGEELSSNDNYFFLLQPVAKAFFYVFQIDSTGKLDWLFPANQYFIHSAGQNPLQVGKWTKVPENDKAFYLDENLGMEHFYIVVTPTRWQVLETALAMASQSSIQNKPILAQLGLKTRGVAGTRIMKIDLPLSMNKGSEQVQQLIKGKEGVLVIEKWFKHVSAK